MISVEHLSKKYGSVRAVDDLTFDVGAGEVLGFLGPNGAGKTTTMRMITGYLPPSRGRVTIDGFDLFDHPVEAKRRVGYLPENPPVYLEMTVRGYLAFVAALKDVPPSRLGAAVDRAIERARLGEVRGWRIGQLSKGFKQRVGLAQAIVHEPPVLILDEPTSSLDPKQRAEVRDLVRQLRGSHTVILSTHILPEVADLADRVVILNRGKVMAVDTPARLGERLRAREVATLEIAPDTHDGAAPPDARTLRAVLGALPGAGHVEIDVTAGGTLLARLESAVGVDLRADAAALVVAQGWRLVGLAGASLSLEEIFLALTGPDDEGGHPGGASASQANPELD